MRAARNVEALTADMDLAVRSVCDRIVVALAGSTLVELSSETARRASAQDWRPPPGSYLTG